MIKITQKYAFYILHNLWYGAANTALAFYEYAHKRNKVGLLIDRLSENVDVLPE